jgi:uncharacterized membrane protein YbhN (UPF0104 family)
MKEEKNSLALTAAARSLSRKRKLESLFVDVAQIEISAFFGASPTSPCFGAKSLVEGGAEANFFLSSYFNLISRDFFFHR